MLTLRKLNRVHLLNTGLAQSAVIAVLVGFAAISVPAMAATWTGSSSNDWGTDANWNPNDWPGNGYGDNNDTAVFDVGTTGNVSPNITGNHAYPQTIQITGTGNTSYTFTGDRQLVIKDGGGITVDSTVTSDQTFNVSVRPDNGTTTYTNNSDAILSFRQLESYWSPDPNQADVVFDGTGAITVDIIKDRSDSRLLSVEKQGTGTLTITGNGNYSAGTTISEGTLQIGNGGTTGSLGTGDTSIADGAVLSINLDPGYGYLYGGQLSGSGTVEIQPDGRLNFAVDQVNSSNLVFDVNGSVTLLTDGMTVQLGALTGSGVVGRGGNNTGLKNVVIGGKNTDSEFSGTIKAELNVEKVGTGKLTLSGNNTYPGATTITSGTLQVDGSIASSSMTTVNPGGTLSGNGQVGPLTLQGGTLSPGASVGTLSAGNTAWTGSGNSFIFEIDDATGTAGTIGGPGWDLLDIIGTLDLTTLDTGGILIDIDTLLPGGGTTPGEMANFDELSDYIWNFVDTTGGITGFEETDFLLDTSGVANAYTGDFGISQIDNSLFLTYTASAVPEPSTFALAALGLMGLAFFGWRKQK